MQLVVDKLFLKVTPTCTNNKYVNMQTHYKIKEIYVYVFDNAY